MLKLSMKIKPFHQERRYQLRDGPDAPNGVALNDQVLLIMLMSKKKG